MGYSLHDCNGALHILGWGVVVVTLRKLILVRIKEHRDRGNEERVHRLEDALAYMDGRPEPCTQ